MMQAVSETFEKNKEFFEAQMAERAVQQENQHRIKLRECEDLLEQWTEASQMWKERSEGQTIDIRWWEAFWGCLSGSADGVRAIGRRI